MSCDTYVNQIMCTLEQLPDETVICINDLLPDCASYDSVRKTLSSLAEKKYIKRIMQGVYQVRPSGVDPQPYDVMQALARNNNWKLVPDTEWARYNLGITSTRPELLCYLYGGRTETYRYGNGKMFRLKNGGSKYISTMSVDAATVVSAFADLKNHPVTSSEVNYMAILLSDEIKEELMRERTSAPARLRPVIEIICDQYGLS